MVEQNARSDWVPGRDALLCLAVHVCMQTQEKGISILFKLVLFEKNFLVLGMNLTM
jgi:hypothetical protein